MTPLNEKIYGLIGYPLVHSFSKNYFNQKFEAEHINAKYINFEIPDIGDLMELIAETPNLSGLNVTIPYKEQVLPYLNDIDPAAKRIGAVNVIKFVEGKNANDFKLIGYNSDYIGFGDSIRPLLKPWMKRALVLGTGGASKAVNVALEDLGVVPQPVSRTKRPGVLTYSDLTPEVMAEHKIIVNTTPLGLYPNVDSCPDIPYDLLDDTYLCYDLLYNPDITLFMRKARQNGAHVKNGLEMLLLQAFAAWNIWQKPVF